MSVSLFLATVVLFPPTDPSHLMKAMPPTQIQQEEEEEKTEKKPVYPPLTALQKEQFKGLLTSIKNRNPEKRRGFEKKMISIGRGAIPFLIEKGTTQHKEQGESIYNCLAALMDERDVVTLKTCYASKTERLRLLSTVKISAMKNRDNLEFLKKALKDESADIRLEAAQGLILIKDPSGLGEIIKKRGENRKDAPPRFFENLTLLKGKVYDSLFAPYLVKEQDSEVKIAAVEVITAIGDVRLKTTLGKMLRDPHNLVQTAAVNALRKLVNGEEPRQFRNVFELVEEVNKWKKDLGANR